MAAAPPRPFERELIRMVDELKHNLPCCPNCDWWVKDKELCAYRNTNVRPPAPVIAFGCWAFENDVPF
jgi:transposase